jgi:hypothetical protein
VCSLACLTSAVVAELSSGSYCWNQKTHLRNLEIFRCFAASACIGERRVGVDGGVPHSYPIQPHLIPFHPSPVFSASDNPTWYPGSYHFMHSCPWRLKRCTHGMCQAGKRTLFRVSLATSKACSNKVCCTSPARGAWLLSAMEFWWKPSRNNGRVESNQKSGGCLQGVPSDVSNSPSLSSSFPCPACAMRCPCHRFVSLHLSVL